MPIEWVDEWMQATGGSLRGDALDFLTEVAVHAPGSTVLWSQPGRAFERCAVEGPPQAPRLVAYFRAEAELPGVLLVFGWPLDQSHQAPLWVWLANLVELLDEAGWRLPRSGPTALPARRRCWRPPLAQVCSQISSEAITTM